MCVCVCVYGFVCLWLCVCGCVCVCVCVCGCVCECVCACVCVITSWMIWIGGVGTLCSRGCNGCVCMCVHVCVLCVCVIANLWDDMDWGCLGLRVSDIACAFASAMRVYSLSFKL